MSRAVGWTLIIIFVIILGTHPGSAAGILQHALEVLQRAGNEFSAFLSKL
jgi:hypothetical protein